MYNTYVCMHIYIHTYVYMYICVYIFIYIYVYGQGSFFLLANGAVDGLGITENQSFILNIYPFDPGVACAASSVGLVPGFIGIEQLSTSKGRIKGKVRAQEGSLIMGLEQLGAFSKRRPIQDQSHSTSAGLPGVLSHIYPIYIPYISHIYS